ncbi:MAG: hypothetical protein VX970_06805 [Planctomycetota bacterium]|nr:hypothetical protein [Planctomycetota bacterium]MEC8337755.1 hypothetical protein [Planctomycetota bacterium]
MPNPLWGFTGADGPGLSRHGKDCETTSRPPDRQKTLLDTIPGILGEREIYGEKE